MPSLTVLEDPFYMPFNRYIDSHGLRIFVLDDVSNSFIQKVAATYESMLAMNGLINIETRAAVKETLQSNYVFQKVGVEGPEYYGGGSNFMEPHPVNGNYKDQQTDYIWEATSKTAASQTNEVIEHLLHTITTIGFDLIYPEWKWADPSSSINLAMQQAIDGGYYDVSSYASLMDSHPEGYMKTIVTEFSYWLVLAEWGYIEFVDKANNNTEFTLRKATDIADQLPLAHQLYLNTFAKVYSVPDKTLIQALFSTETPYDFSTYTGLESVAGSILADQLYGNGLDNTITGDAGNDTIFADGGSDTIKGGSGIDTIKYTLSQANYTLAKLGDSNYTVKEISNGTDDNVSTVERIVFADNAIAFDIDGANSAGGIYRTYKAAFNRTPEDTGFGYWIWRADAGASAVQIAEEFVGSKEFQTLYNVATNDPYLGSSNITAVVDLFYQNVLGRAPDQGGLDYYASTIQDREKTTGQVLAEIADSTENRLNLIGTIELGMQYHHFG